MSFIRRVVAAAALLCCLVASAAQAQLVEVTGFGSNPGNLRMWEYIPAGLPADAPLVVMMHGCAQKPQDVDDESGWLQMADAYGFAMVFPQTTFREPGLLGKGGPCFRAYDANHNRRGMGEAASVKQMTDWMLAHRGLDPKRVYVTGFSAGAIMTGAMIASYPDVYAAGAIMSGHPYGCATTYKEYAGCNLKGKDRTPQQWGDLVRSAWPGYAGRYPPLSIWHGTADIVIRPSSADEEVEQWTNAQGIDATADEYSVVNGYGHSVYENAAGKPLVERWKLTLAGHAIQIHSFGLYQPKCGKLGLSTQPSSICEVYYVAKWFGIAG